MSIDKFGKTVDAIQGMLVWFVVFVITISIAVLFLFDVLAGTGTMLFLTNGKMLQSVVISLATTGLLFALMFIGYMLMESKAGAYQSVGGLVLFLAGIIYIMDIIFDALLADILRYGTIGVADNLQWMFRVLLGGISTVGDALAMALIIGLPVLKNIIGGALGAKVDSGSNKNFQPQPKRVDRNQRQQELEQQYRTPKPQQPTPRPFPHNNPPNPMPTYHPMNKMHESDMDDEMPEFLRGRQGA